MNWRGAFRLWIVISAVWLIFAAFIATHALRRISAPVYLYYEDQPIEFPAR